MENKEEQSILSQESSDIQGNQGNYNNQRNYENQADYNNQPNYNNQANYNNQLNYNNQANYNNQPNYNNQANYNNQFNYNNQPNYNMQGNWNPGSYQNGMPQSHPVTDVFYYLFFSMMIVDFIISFVRIGMMRAGIKEFVPYRMHYSQSLFGAGLSAISLVFALAGFVFLILDIFKIAKAKYPVVGLVLFGILLRPGYFVWRAYILKRKKLVPILFTVFTGILAMIDIVMAFQTAFSMMMLYMNSIR